MRTPETINALGLQESLRLTVADLLPVATSNIGMPIATPVRWGEAYQRDQRSPDQTNLWLAFDGARDSTMAITRFHHPRTALDTLWSVSLREPTAETDADEHTINAALSQSGNMEVQRILFDDTGACVRSEQDYTLDGRAKQVLLGKVTGTLALAREVLPVEQYESLYALGALDKAGSFRAMGSPVGQRAIRTLLST